GENDGRKHVDGSAVLAERAAENVNRGNAKAAEGVDQKRAGINSGLAGVGSGGALNDHRARAHFDEVTGALLGDIDIVFDDKGSGGVVLIDEQVLPSTAANAEAADGRGGQAAVVNLDGRGANVGGDQNVIHGDRAALRDVNFPGVHAVVGKKRVGLRLIDAQGTPGSAVAGTLAEGRGIVRGEIDDADAAWVC